jgi:uncharacterized membrane protein YqiK
MTDMTANLSLVLLLAAAVVVVVAIALLSRQYKRCPEGKLLVVYGAGLPDCCVVVESGGRFVLPIVQESAYLSLEEVQLPQHAGYPRAVRIGGSAALRRNAAIQLLGLSRQEIVAKVEELLRSSPEASSTLHERLEELGLEVA